MCEGMHAVDSAQASVRVRPLLGGIFEASPLDFNTYGYVGEVQVKAWHAPFPAGQYPAVPFVPASTRLLFVRLRGRVRPQGNQAMFQLLPQTTPLCARARTRARMHACTHPSRRSSARGHNDITRIHMRAVQCSAVRCGAVRCSAVRCSAGVPTAPSARCMVHAARRVLHCTLRASRVVAPTRGIVRDTGSHATCFRSTSRRLSSIRPSPAGPRPARSHERPKQSSERTAPAPCEYSRAA
jgi:hypothetical protein